MERVRRNQELKFRTVVAAAAVSLALTGVFAAPALAGSASHQSNANLLRSTPRSVVTHDDSGSAFVLPEALIAPTPMTLHFKFTATATFTAGVVSVAVPAGWPAPTLINTAASTGSLSTGSSTITVSDLNLTSGQFVVINYGAAPNPVTPPSTPGYDTFTVSTSTTSSGALVSLSSSPIVFVYTKASAMLFNQVTSVPLAAFNTVGVTSHAIFVVRPSIKYHQPPFVAVVNGVKVPGAIYVGADWCPFCGPTRWGVIVALARFGHFNQFYEAMSSPVDVFGNTPSLTFYLSTYKSSYLSFAGYEIEGPFMGQALMHPPKAAQLLFNKYGMGSLPFFDVGNLSFINQGAFTPAAIAGMTDAQIANGLSTASGAVARAIIASANYFSAGICASDGEKPGSVCKSAGVIKADVASGLPRG